jgi:hypothetical protein
VSERFGLTTMVDATEAVYQAALAQTALPVQQAA